MVARHLSIGDYKRPLWKGLVNCPYHSRPENRRFCRLLIGVEVAHRGDDWSTASSYHATRDRMTRYSNHHLSLVWPDRFFPFFFVTASQRKTEKSGLATRDYHHLCEPLQHQLTIDKICRFSGRECMGSSPDPFWAGAYNLQSISAPRP